MGYSVNQEKEGGRSISISPVSTQSLPSPASLTPAEELPKGTLLASMPASRESASTEEVESDESEEMNIAPISEWSSSEED